MEKTLYSWGGVQTKFSRIKNERFFLEAIKRAKLLYVIPTGGYLGRSASIETAYCLAVKTPVLTSEQIRVFGEAVPFSIQSIIIEYPPPVVQLSDIQEYGRNIVDFARRGGNLPNLTDQQKSQVFSSLFPLLRDLR